MTEVFADWIRSLAGAAMFSAIAITLTPSGRVKSVLKAVCGLIVVLALINPLIGFDLSAYGNALAKYRERLIAETDTTAGDRLSRIIIENETRAYILDKAQAMGLYPDSVTVTAKWGDGFWIPHEVSIRGEFGGKSEALANLIEAQLGIPKDRQYWSDSDDREPES